MEEKENKYFLQQISLAGYKSIRETTIEIQSNLSIIIGKNAAGKTNFLFFLNKVLNYDFEGMYNFKSLLTFAGKKDIRLEAQNNLSDNLSKAKNSFSKNEYKFVVTTEETSNEYDASQYPKLIERLEKENFTCFSTLISHGIPDPYEVVDRPFTFTTNNNGWSSDLLDYVFKLQHSYFIKSLLMSFLYESDEVSDTRKTNETSIKKIQLRLQKFIFNELEIIKPFLKQYSPIEDIRYNENYNVFESKTNEELTVSNLFFEFKVNGDWHPFSNLSDGTKRLLYIISEIALPGSFSFAHGRIVKHNNETSRIILIEEPELGIHPHQLHMLMLFLKEQSRSKQIIITTHSPQVLDILGPNDLNSIVLASYDYPNGTILRHLSGEEIKKAKKYIKEEFLSDYWIHSDLEITN